ncbi:MAG: T9SS type A sorting domain-containing protein [Candidatus Marinimicrobia bacterium]|nr:T9SS type A sorting domain-containing protein [Candidatus Neomarinimicrobiota bacterium]
MDSDSMIAMFGAPWYRSHGGDPEPREVTASVPQQYLENQAMCMKPSGAYYEDPVRKDRLVITDMALGCVQELAWSETARKEPPRHVPYSLALDQNYPNPFNPRTNIRFRLPEAGKVALSISDLSGKRVREIFSGRLEAGDHNILFDASELPSGNYFYTLHVNAFSVTRKMTLVK